MRFFAWLLSLPVFAIVLIFALQNRAEVTVSFWPFDATATMPLSLFSLGLLIAGFLCGVIVMFFLNLGTLLEKRRLTKEVASLGAKMKEKEAAASVPVPGPTILSQGRYQVIPQPKEKPAGRFGWLRRKK